MESMAWDTPGCEVKWLCLFSSLLETLAPCENSHQMSVLHPDCTPHLTDRSAHDQYTIMSMAGTHPHLHPQQNVSSLH